MLTVAEKSDSNLLSPEKLFSIFLPPLIFELFYMISTPDRQVLLALCDKFINSGEDVTLAHLLDLVNSTILDHESKEFKNWSKYMEKLNEAWVLINKENEQIPWPDVHKYTLSQFLISYMAAPTRRSGHRNDGKFGCGSNSMGRCSPW
jgi:hypothetical protein